MAIWKTHKSWVYEYFEADENPATFTGFEDLVTMWNLKRGERAAPSWSEFDFYDFVGWHGSLILTEYLYDPFDFKYHIFGTKIANRMGMDPTGKLASTIAGSKYDPTLDFDFFEMAGRGLYITKVSRDVEWASLPTSLVTYIELPMSDDGKFANRYITALRWGDA